MVYPWIFNLFPQGSDGLPLDFQPSYIGISWFTMGFPTFLYRNLMVFTIGFPTFLQRNLMVYPRIFNLFLQGSDSLPWDSQPSYIGISWFTIGLPTLSGVLPTNKNIPPPIRKPQPIYSDLFLLLAAFALAFFLQGLDQDCIASGFLIHL